MINLDDKYRLTANQYCYTIEKKANSDEKSKKQKWTPVGHYNTLDHALRDYMEFLIKDDIGGLQVVTTLKDIVNTKKKLDKKIKELFEISKNMFENDKK